MASVSEESRRSGAAAEPAGSDLLGLALDLMGRTEIDQVLGISLGFLSRRLPGAGWAILHRLDPSTYGCATHGRVGQGDLRWLAKRACDEEVRLCVESVASTKRLRGRPLWWVVDDPMGSRLVLACWPGRRSVDAQLMLRLETAARILASAVDSARSFESIQERTYRDSLTELLNRRGILEVLRRERARALRYGRPLSVLFVDLDRFKEINDGFGHAVGDEMLRGVARRLEQALRRCDAVGRFGGDEFLIVLPDTGLGTARRIGARLTRDVGASPLMTSVGEIPVLLSCGESVESEESSEAGLIELADQRMLARKRRRRSKRERLGGFAEPTPVASNG